MWAIGQDPPLLPMHCADVPSSHVWLYEGAEGRKWLMDLEIEMLSRGKPVPAKFTPASDVSPVSPAAQA